VKRCPRSGLLLTAPFPTGVNAPAQYGPRFNGWLVYLRTQQLFPLERIRQMSADLFGQAISEGTIQAAVTLAYERLSGFETTTLSLLAQAKIAHADETGLRITAKLY